MALSPQQALYGGADAPPAPLPPCVHYAGSEKFVRKALALQAEYAPAPPFQTGTPETSRPEILAPMKAMFSPLVEQMRSAAKPQP